MMTSVPPQKLFLALRTMRATTCESNGANE